MEINTAMRHQLIPIGMPNIKKKKKNQKIISAGQDVEKLEHLCIVVGNVNWYSHYVKQ